MLESYYGREQCGIFVVEAWLGSGENLIVVVRS